MSIYVIIPIVVGILVGWIFTLPIVLTLAAFAFAIGLFALWRTSGWELGSLIGAIAAAVLWPGALSAVVTTLLVNNVVGAIDLSWLLRIS